MVAAMFALYMCRIFFLIKLSLDFKELVGLFITLQTEPVVYCLYYWQEEELYAKFHFFTPLIKMANKCIS